MLIPFLVADGIVVFGTARLLSRRVGLRAGATAGAFLLLTPLLWHQVVLRGQDEPVFHAALLLAVAAATAGRFGACGLLLGLGAILTKATFAPYALAVLLAVSGTPGAVARCVAAAAVPLAAAVGLHLGRGGTLFGLIPGSEVDPGFVGFGPLALLGSSWNRWFSVAVALSMAATAAVAGGFALRTRGLNLLPRATVLLCAVHATFLLTSPKSLREYEVQACGFMVALALLGPRGAQERTLFGGLAVLGAVCGVYLDSPPVAVSGIAFLAAFHLFLLWRAWEFRLRAPPGGSRPIP